MRSNQLRLRSIFRLLPVLLLIIVVGCNFPVPRRSSPTGTPSQILPTQAVTPEGPALPTQAAEPLPPAVVESSPQPGSILPLDAPITLYFNQPMDRASVEAALSGAPTLAGRFTWNDDRTLTFAPDAPFLPDTSLSLTVTTSAKSQMGLALYRPVSLSYKTAGYLQVSQKLPDPGAVDVDPDAAVAVTFNQPVVPLGADQAALPPAFTVEPAATGRGEWLNTSTYIFHPDPPLTGGVQYTARLSPDLKSTDGGPLQTPGEWSFTVALPRLDKIEPADGQGGVRLDAPVKLTFNQRMNPDSVQASFALLDASHQPVPGKVAWNKALTELTFTPSDRLQRDSRYTVRFSAQVSNAGGVPLVMPTQTSWTTEPALSIHPIQPEPNGSLDVYGSLQLGVSASLPDQDLRPFFSLLPAVTNLNVFFDPEAKAVNLYGDLAADTDYVVVVAGDLPDAWGGTLGQDYLLPFHTKPLNPTLQFPSPNMIQFLTPQDTSIPAQAANLLGLYLYRGKVTLSDFIALSGSQAYNFQQTYQPANEQKWFTTLYASPQRVQPVDIPVSPDGSPLAPGLYYLRFDQSAVGYAMPLTLVVSRINLTLKMSATDAFVWAVDLRDKAPVAGLSVSVFDDAGTPLTSGLTDTEGVFQGAIPPQSDPYRMYYAIAEQPGDEHFGLTLLNWAEGIGPDTFGIPTSFNPPGLKTYVYTDRPIYRPGQTVYFRVVARQVRDDHYSLPSQPSLAVTVYDSSGARLNTYDLPLSEYGSVNGEYTLISDAAPGYYRLESGATSIYFQVAAYRKPEIDLQISLARDQIQLGETISATVHTQYFFGASAGDVALNWAIYQSHSFFNLPDYQVGPEDYGWLDVFPAPSMPGFLGDPIAQGSGKTAPDGSFAVVFPTSAGDDKSGKAAGMRNYTLEVTVTDESGQPVSSRAVVQVHPAPFYVGLRPDAWVGQAGSEVGFDVVTVDWGKNPSGNRTLHGEFRKVTWMRKEPQLPGGFPTFVPQYTPVSSADFRTSPDGKARLAFTPPEPGTYQLEVSGEGAVTQATLWVGGPGQAVWPNTPNQRLRLTADKESYLPGQEAQVFIPNPFGSEVFALVTVERSSVLRHQVLRLGEAGSTLTFPLSSDDAPNIYVSALLIGSSQQNMPDFRLGMVELPVTPVAQTLQVTLTSQPERTGPGEPVTFGIRVTDSQGNPVQGEFSLALVDKAVLRLADANAPGILEAFYGQQPLGVRTGVALAGYARRSAFLVGGIGGGGAAEPPIVREKFPDTAYWSAEIVTDANGEANVEVALPDSLTTWVADLRGLTVDTRVGQAVAQVITTKDLLVRPVTPRFLVAGDHAMLAAVVQNNTANDLLVDVALQSTGFALDEGAANTASRQVSVAAGGRVRVEWWGVAQDAPDADLVFSAQSGDLQDAARPALGALPILRYTAPQAFATAGVLENAGQRLELVSLPAAQQVSGGGELRLELAPSLVAAMETALNLLEGYPYDCTEQILSRFLPNLEVYQAMQALGITAPDLKSRLDRTLASGLSALQARQNSDGGWSWWAGGESDPFITAYVLFGLSRARTAGISVNPDTFQRASDYLFAGLPTPDMTPEGWQLDRLTFEQFALAAAGRGDIAGAEALFAVRDRLSPWAQAMLAQTIQALKPGGSEIQALTSDLQATASRTGSGAFWEDRNSGWSNMSTALSTTAIVTYALAQLEPASPLLPEAARYLMSNRQATGGWNSTYETAWVLMGLTEFARGTGELSGNFPFEAAVNGVSLASGQAGGDAWLNAVNATLPTSQMIPNAPNALTIQRGEGPGRLYYSAVLDVHLPAEAAAPLNHGLAVSRAYYPRLPACLAGDCAPVQSAQVNQQVTVAVTLVVPQDAYYVLVEDTIPAGTEILDTGLKTSQLGGPGEQNPEAATPPGPAFDPANPFAEGWGWWLFHNPQIFDDHIAWSADHLPAGTYVLKYVLTALQPGEYRTLPARARQFYFPDVQGNSAGATFTVTP